MGKFKRVFAISFALIMAFTFIACGSVANQGIDDQAAVRGLDEGVGEIYIDETKIALASKAASTQAALDACQAVFNLMNQERAARGLASLTWSVALENAAKVRAGEITTKFSHTRPNNSDFWTVDSTVQYGENLAKLYQSADSVYTAWMNSPTHAANMMDAGYKTVGIAIFQTEDGSWYWAQEFGY